MIGYARLRITFTDGLWVMAPLRAKAIQGAQKEAESFTKRMLDVKRLELVDDDHQAFSTLEKGATRWKTAPWAPELMRPTDGLTPLTQ